MKNSVKGFVLGFACALVLSSSVIFADSLLKNIEVFENGVKFMVNGKVIQGENFIYNGTTYAPVRKVAELLGVQVAWEDATKTVSLNSKEYAQTTSTETIATVNEVEIPVSKLVKMMDSKKPEGMSDEEYKNSVINNLVTMESANQKLKAEGFELTEEEIANIASMLKAQEAQFVQQGVDIELVKESFILRTSFNNYIEKKIKPDITEATLLADYEKNKETYKKDTVKAKHILIKTVGDDNQKLPEDKLKEAKAKAEKIIADLKKGADFDKLMNESSEDPGLKTSPDGYTFGKGEMVPEFEKEAFGLEKGKVSGIVETQFGYHIIKLIDKYGYTPFEAVKNDISSNILNQKAGQIIDDWSKASKININKELLAEIKVPVK